jgi:F0F1-type ATP synthase assembly protein I
LGTAVAIDECHAVKEDKQHKRFVGGHVSRTSFAETGRATEVLQNTLDRNEPRILASYALIGAILLLGGIGYGIDWWAGTAPWFLLIGLLAGMVFGFYNLVCSLRSH